MINKTDKMILVLNAGSSSVKFALFTPTLDEIAAGSVTEIGSNARLAFAKSGCEPTSKPIDAKNHEAAIALVLVSLADAGFGLDKIGAAAHRVVHGGKRFSAPARVTDDVLEGIESCNSLAPLHNPHNLAGILALKHLLPDLPQFASFDTAFHSTVPDVASRYAIPAAHEADGIRRYGFHGISYASLVVSLPEISGQPLPHRLIAFHLGNGASACAIVGGRSVATTMGYSPLDGLTMGTRSGAIDGNAVLQLAEKYGLARARQILNRESGLLALGGASDMRSLSQSQTPEAQFAIEHFCYWAARHAGSLIAASEGVDAIAFTGGIGENDQNVRNKIMNRLAWTGLSFGDDRTQPNMNRLHDEKSLVQAWIVPAREERHIAQNALDLLS